jgi:hypothetical protein
MIMYSITVLPLEGHRGLGTPITHLVTTKDEVFQEVKQWASDATFFDHGESPETVADDLERWDGEETLDFRDADGEEIVIQRHVFTV